MRVSVGLMALGSFVLAASGASALQAQQPPPSHPISSPAALRSAAEAIDPLGKAAEAEAAWQAYLEALEITGGPVADQAFALNRMGDSRYYQQNMQGGLDASLEAKRRLEAANEAEGEPMADTLANIATFRGALGQSDLELPLQEQSLAIRKRLYGTDPTRLPPEQAKSLGLGYLNYANALYTAGRFSEAADLVKPSIDGVVTGELRDATLFVAMSSGANMLIDAGRTAEALELAQRGVTTATQLLPEEHPFIGFAHATLAKVLLQSDRFVEAEAPARRAVDIMVAKLGPNNRNTMTAVHNLGVILARLGRFEESIALTMAGHDAVRKIDPGNSINQLVSASNAAHEAGKQDMARDLAQRAASVAETVPDGDSRAAKGLTVLALRQDEAGDAKAALQTLDSIVARRARAGVASNDTVLDLQRGLFQIKAGDREAGWKLASRAATAIEADLIADAERFELGADLASYYETIMHMVEAAFAADRPDDALHAFELAGWGVNARTRQLLALKTSVEDQPALAGKVEAFETGSARLRILYRERAALLASDKTEAAAARASEITTLADSLAQLRAELVTAIPDFGQWVRPATPTVQQVQARLSPDEAILIAMPGRSRTFTMVITANGAVMASSEQGRPTVRALVSDLRLTLDGKRPSEVAGFARNAAALHDIVLPERAAAALAGHKRVAVVTSDALSRLPFSVLLPAVPSVDQKDFKGMDWMARRHAFSIALTPSAAFAKRDDGATRFSFLGVGAPTLSGVADPANGSVNLFRGGSAAIEDVRSLRPLPASAGEIAKVAAIRQFSTRLALTGDDATELRVRQASGTNYAVLLFATHGLMDGEVAGLNEPALVLTPPAQAGSAENDGLLLASEIGALGLGADFVILSACNSAAGRNETAPAYTGLANAFLGSGAQGLLLSHWRVRDDAAAYLSTLTVERALAGTPHAEALRQTQIALIDGKAGIADSANPSIWAPFVLVER
ncbi:CHAT domain-containing tetratricopeptide repeat protein [Blastomonas sp. AAP53]|uniref:CHAT domain-containing tetratricopeptide repeat protein n=1 Tax=Blastomonas sp. AAP53 TaxID=1248760 RepID=UPI0002F483C5|nr:CHAT domain-containing tetratricopeptide repeat protein [Blastomonas sp. AAP53]